jgi:predicted DNA-binding WGR domain protein
MTALPLRRSDPARNLQRYYRLDLQLDLFGTWCLTREWGRIGRSGQPRTVPYPTEAAVGPNGPDGKGRQQATPSDSS